MLILWQLKKLRAAYVKYIKNAWKSTTKRKANTTYKGKKRKGYIKAIYKIATTKILLTVDSKSR